MKTLRMIAVLFPPLIAGCGGGDHSQRQADPVSPTAVDVRVASPTAIQTAARQNTVVPAADAPVPFPPGGDFTPQDVSFPPRNEPVDFGNQLNGLYRDTLRRTTVTAFVALEDWVVWIQEYIRYRVNLCTHVDAVARVFSQIRGGGVLPVCGSAPSGQVLFPPRDQSFDFGTQLNAFYRDSLGRSPVGTFVDLEGWIVWIQEYLRYRVNTCGHAEAVSRVFTQINGGGIQPDCTAPPPPSGGGAFIRFTTDSTTCRCWIGLIRLEIGGTTAGTMTCTETRTFEVSPGTYAVRACDANGCVQSATAVARGGIATLPLRCTGLRSDKSLR